MAGPCWARRHTAGSGSAALVGQESHLPKPETGQQNQIWNPFNNHLWFKAAHPEAALRDLDSCKTTVHPKIKMVLFITLVFFKISFCEELPEMPLNDSYLPQHSGSTVNLIMLKRKTYLQCQKHKKWLRILLNHEGVWSTLQSGHKYSNVAFLWDQSYNH